MKRTKTIVGGLVALVAVLVLGAFSVGAAQAHTFLWSGAVPSLLLILSDGAQSFFAIPQNAGGAAVTCQHAGFHGTVEAKAQVTQKVSGRYTKCTAFGSPATVTPAEYELSAEGTVSVLNTITIEVPLVGCKIIVPAAHNQNLNKIRYLVDPKSENTRLLPHAEVEKIHSTIVGGGGLCGEEGLHTEGEYRGLLLAWVHGAGALTWE